MGSPHFLLPFWAAKRSGEGASASLPLTLPARASAGAGPSGGASLLHPSWPSRIRCLGRFQSKRGHVCFRRLRFPGTLPACSPCTHARQPQEANPSRDGSRQVLVWKTNFDKALERLRQESASAPAPTAFRQPSAPNGSAPRRGRGAWDEGLVTGAPQPDQPTQHTHIHARHGLPNLRQQEQPAVVDIGPALFEGGQISVCFLPPLRLLQPSLCCQCFGAEMPMPHAAREQENGTGDFHPAQPRADYYAAQVSNPARPGLFFLTFPCPMIARAWGSARRRPRGWNPCKCPTPPPLPWNTLFTSWTFSRRL
jgi:hypothetical protein